MIHTDDQLKTCRRLGAGFLESAMESKLGLAMNATTVGPIHGLRHLPAKGTCGWYIWQGEVMGTDPDFFKPLHVSHFAQRFPQIIPYLGLEPGWRFVLAPGYEDAWFDSELVHE